MTLALSTVVRAHLSRPSFGSVTLPSQTDLKPENLLFRTPADDADIMIADFGLSRVMEEEKLSLLTEICGTPGVSRDLTCFHLRGQSRSSKQWRCGGLGHRMGFGVNVATLTSSLRLILHFPLLTGDV